MRSYSVGNAETEKLDLQVRVREGHGVAFPLTDFVKRGSET